MLIDMIEEIETKIIGGIEPCCDMMLVSECSELLNELYEYFSKPILDAQTQIKKEKACMQNNQYLKDRLMHNLKIDLEQDLEKDILIPIYSSWKFERIDPLSIRDVFRGTRIEEFRMRLFSIYEQDSTTFDSMINALQHDIDEEQQTMFSKLMHTTDTIPKYGEIFTFLKKNYPISKEDNYKLSSKSFLEQISQLNCDIMSIVAVEEFATKIRELIDDCYEYTKSLITTRIKNSTEELLRHKIDKFVVYEECNQQLISHVYYFAISNSLYSECVCKLLKILCDYITYYNQCCNRIIEECSHYQLY